MRRYDTSPGRNTEISVTRVILVGQIPAVFAQAGRCSQRDAPFGLGPVVVDWRDREDKPALAEADRLDQDRAAGPGQDDHITGIDITSKDHILHR
jgi:Asp-tRNA(Asn)/Glu-tRNA(Gln) amidotransferase A subunit family amidase